MRYMLLIYGSDAFDDGARAARDHESVRVPDGKRLVTDGPFAETREQLGCATSSSPTEE